MDNLNLKESTFFYTPCSSHIARHLHAWKAQTNVLIYIPCVYIDELIVPPGANPIKYVYTDTLYSYKVSVKYFYIQLRPGTSLFLYNTLFN